MVTEEKACGLCVSSSFACVCHRAFNQGAGCVILLLHSGATVCACTTVSVHTCVGPGASTFGQVFSGDLLQGLWAGALQLCWIQRAQLACCCDVRASA